MSVLRYYDTGSGQWLPVVVGAQGTNGVQGTTGRDGNFGGETVDYTFDSSTTSSDPGQGKVRFNNANLTLATAMYIDALNDAGTDISTLLNTIDDSTSVIKGHFQITKKFDSSVWALYTISLATNNTGWFTVSCAYLSGSTTSFTNLDDVIITFARTGDKGDTGIQGVQGLVGIQGTQGSSIQGTQGVQGTQGTTGTGTQGTTGTQGVQGLQGPYGPILTGIDGGAAATVFTANINGGNAV